MNYEIGVIGGGVIGLACAWRLAQQRARVALFDRGEVASEASWAAAGMLGAQSEATHHPPASAENLTDEGNTESAMLRLCLQSRELYTNFANELEEVSGHSIELSLEKVTPGDYRVPGILHIVHHDEPGIDVLAHQPQVQELSRAEVNALLGENDTLGGDRFFWMAHEGQVESRKLGQALAIAAKRTGVEIYTQTPVEKLIFENDRVVGVETTAGRFRCEKVLLAGGAWSAQIENLPEDCAPPVYPVGGEVLSLRPPHPPRVVIYTAGVYLVPRLNGQLLLGATMRDSGFDKQTTPQGAEQLLEAAREIYPALRGIEPEAHWCGLRPATPDGLPILGPTPQDNLFVATGHYRNGILLTPVTAKLMMDSILYGIPIDPAFSLERFVTVL